AQIVAPGGRTVFNQAVMLRSFLRLENFSVPGPQARSRAFVNPYAVVWGFRPDWNLTVVVPFVTLDTEQSIRGERTEDTRSGFADAQIFLKYDGLYKKNVRRGFTRLAGEFGVRVPSGRSGFTSNTVDYLFALIFSHVRDRHWLVADSQYLLTRENSGGTNPGNHWNYDFAYLYRLLPWRGFEGKNLFLVGELNGEFFTRNRMQGVSVANSGGNILFFSPGVQFLPTRQIVLEFAAPVPIYRDLNGLQPKPTSTFIMGIRYLF
ncbi:MAG: hypothetical protein O7F56_07400, partial [Acidobacteria bacterium]|nr:hypothetical protein [Acidobacteriota bacterium]